MLPVAPDKYCKDVALRPLMIDKFTIPDERVPTVALPTFTWLNVPNVLLTELKFPDEALILEKEFVELRNALNWSCTSSDTLVNRLIKLALSPLIVRVVIEEVDKVRISPTDAINVSVIIVLVDREALVRKEILAAKIEHEDKDKLVFCRNASNWGWMDAVKPGKYKNNAEFILLIDRVVSAVMEALVQLIESEFIMEAETIELVMFLNRPVSQSSPEVDTVPVHVNVLNVPVDPDNVVISPRVADTEDTFAARHSKYEAETDEAWINAFTRTFVSEAEKAWTKLAVNVLINALLALITDVDIDEEMSALIVPAVELKTSRTIVLAFIKLVVIVLNVLWLPDNVEHETNEAENVVMLAVVNDIFVRVMNTSNWSRRVCTSEVSVLILFKTFELILLIKLTDKAVIDEFVISNVSI